MLKKWRKVVLWVVILPTALLLLYVFSVGPVVFLISHFGLHSNGCVDKVIVPFYRPLDRYVIEGRPLESYIIWWENLAEKTKANPAEKAQ